MTLQYIQQAQQAASGAAGAAATASNFIPGLNAVTGVASLGLGVYSAIAGANAAQKAQDAAVAAANTAKDKQWKFDLQAYKLNKQKILKQYGDTIKKIDLAAKNEQALANYKDANALDSYAQALKIKDLQQLAQNNAYLKSEQLYKTQLSLNEQAAQYAKETQFAALQEEVAKFAAANNNLIIENMLNSAKAVAKGTSGNAAVKTAQAFVAAQGGKQAMADKSLSSLQQSSLLQLQKLQQDKNAADVTAFAQKLLPPQEIPDPITPYETPLTEYIYPDPPSKFDFGPIPQQGVMNQTQNVWANTFSQVLPGITQSANAVAQNIFQPQQPPQMGQGVNPYTALSGNISPLFSNTNYSSYKFSPSSMTSPTTTTSMSSLGIGGSTASYSGVTAPATNPLAPYY